KAAISVDGPPWLAGVMFGEMDSKARQNTIDQMITGMENQSEEQFKANQQMTYSTMVEDQETAKEFAEMGEQSDPATVTKAMSELMNTNLSDSLKTMDVPTLHLFAVKPY